MFANKSQIDVVSVLMLLGEATIWKIIWSRSRSRRTHPSHFAFAISPGWAPLAGAIFAALHSPGKAPNLIYDRPPEGQLEDGLLLTNLNSGATHSASNTILQNLWQTWVQELRRKSDTRGDEFFDITRSVGVIEVDLNKLHMEARSPVYIHLFCLIMQFGGSLTLSLMTHSYEVLAVLSVALVSQTLLLLSIQPAENAWFKTPRGYRSSPVMLHKSLDSMGVLIIRQARNGSKYVSLEEYCWDSQASVSNMDRVKLAITGFSFVLFILQIVLVGWMQESNRIAYLVMGLIGLFANMCEAIIPLNWSKAQQAYSGISNCAPNKGSMMSAVALLIAGRFPASQQAARLLYPENERFAQSLTDLSTLLQEVLCDTCRGAVRHGLLGQNQFHRCQRLSDARADECARILAEKANENDVKQLSDGMAAVCHYLASLRGAVYRMTVDTTGKIATTREHTWD